MAGEKLRYYCSKMFEDDMSFTSCLEIGNMISFTAKGESLEA